MEYQNDPTAKNMEIGTEQGSGVPNDPADSKLEWVQSRAVEYQMI